MSTISREVVVVGGGAAGCGAALSLAQNYNGWKVCLFEKNTLFSGTSSKTAGRLGLGFHYMDLQTSEMLLRATIRFVKTYPGFRVGESLPWSHPLRHGRYFITTNSYASTGKLLLLYEALKQVYTEIVKEDSSNMVFGPPEDFYRILKREEYEKEVDTSKVALGIETAEHLLNWVKFQEYFVRCIRSHENISVEEHTELVGVKRRPCSSTKYRYVLNFKSRNGKEREVHSDYVVNSTWHEIEKLNEFAGFRQLSQTRTNRLKALLRVRLPISMHDSHSKFFCIGPFCMFSNLGDGTALVTYAPVSNVEMSSEISVSKKMIRLLTKGPTEFEFRSLSEGIHRGVTGFIPGLEHSEIVDIRFGIVQTHDTVDLHDINSPVHTRAYFGVRSECAGWVSNPCMKLMYLLENGDITRDILEKQFKKDNRL